jgi:hypothetical protein
MQNPAVASKLFEEKAKGQKLQGMTDEQGGENEQDPGRPGYKNKTIKWLQREESLGFVVCVQRVLNSRCKVTGLTRVHEYGWACVNLT